jgi:signal transduction histidine kinase
LNGVAASFYQQARSLGQTLELNLPPALPLAPLDPQRIRQVVANLVSNALRHASEPPPGTGRGRVEISALERPGEVQVSVIDNGPGIRPEELPHVFDRFWQGQRTRAGSSGLGLAIARELVRAHGGQIWAESTAGLGATFRFTLPLAGAASELAGPPVA